MHNEPLDLYCVTFVQRVLTFIDSNLLNISRQQVNMEEDCWVYIYQLDSISLFQFAWQIIMYYSMYIFN